MTESRETDVLRIGLVQQPVPGPGSAAAEAERHIRAAADAGAEVVVLPELWNIGYRLPTPQQAASADFRAAARQLADEFLGQMTEVARELRVAVVATYLGADGDTLGNCAALVGVDGTVLLRYTKVHVARFAGERAFTSGKRLLAGYLTRPDGRAVRVGLMICYDRVFPEAGRALALAGAEVVLVPNAGPLCLNREAQVRTRAFENQYAIAVANYSTPPMAGASLVCDGIAFDEDGSARDMVTWRADAEPTVGVADIPLGRLRAYRSAQPWGLADRVPAAYRR
ncbi:carbon-nitrogen hydrolase family protein [Micromonospora sp. D93]|uniref:carbon-nitrogen hydrolase family protein n=1 Tax=Micromonospora sp. D93 TaxID=2824886 RepID=UPI001B393E74|nr:carbon-nitrogen hydrolase family protein [Micromonospora sp. D93]MBQ1017638.1 carbon-nitrogen hydrolase family protein [Micromonospora sp. D93]